MRIRKILDRQIRHRSEGVEIAGDVNAVISANVNEPGTTVTSTRSHNTIVQRSGRTKNKREVSDAGSEHDS